jgi:hypothetical protein
MCGKEFQNKRERLSLAAACCFGRMGPTEVQEVEEDEEGADVLKNGGKKKAPLGTP